MFFAYKNLIKTSPIYKIQGLKEKKFEKAYSAGAFKLADAVFYKNEKVALKELMELVKYDDDAIYIIATLVYQLRNIAYAKFGLEYKLAPFVKSKAIKMAGLFSEEKIKQLFNVFYGLDKDLKTGRISPSAAPIIAINSVLS